VKPRTRVRGPAFSVLAVSAALLMGGCTATVDPTVTSAPTVSSEVPTSSPSSIAPVTSPPATSRSAGTTSPATSTNPWPADLTSEQAAQAQAAITAYVRYSEVVDRAFADPGRDWSAEVAQWATDPAKSSLLQNLTGTAALGQYTSGAIALNPTVTKVESGLITIRDCVDSTNTDFFDSTGRSIKAPDVPGSYFRHISEVQVALYETGQWLVTFITDDYNTTC